MRSDDLLKLDTWRDAYQAVHEDMRGDTRGFIHFGVSIIHMNSSKQKMNLKITT